MPSSKLPWRVFASTWSCGGQLVEIQHGSLAAIRDKVAELLKDHRVLVVKPVVIRKRIINHAAQGGPVLSSRLSPRQGQVLDLFHELIYFTRVFPHQNLCLEVPLVDIEELRHPGHGRRRRWRRRDHQVADQRLVKIHHNPPIPYGPRSGAPAACRFTHALPHRASGRRFGPATLGGATDRVLLPPDEHL